MKNISCIILHYKSYPELYDCLLSVSSNKSSGGWKLKITVIDADYNLKDQAKLMQKFKNIRFINRKENLGVSKGFNIGIKEALKNGSDYIFLVTPSIIISKDLINKLYGSLEKHDVDVAGSKVLLNTNPKKIHFAFGLLDKKTKTSIHLGYGEIDKNQYDKHHGSDFLNFPILIKREVFEKIGLFKEKYFMYYEDTDFYLRAKREGFKLKVNPQALSFLNKKKSYKTPLRDYYLSRNALIFISENFGGLEKFIAISYRIRELIYLIIDYVRNKDRKSKYFKILGYIDFFKGKNGYKKLNLET